MPYSLTLPETLIVFIMISWLAINIAYACFNKKMGAYTNRFDLFRWISAYQLFSTTSGHYRLSYRDIYADESAGNWQIIPLASPYKWYHALYYTGVVIDAVKSSVDDMVVYANGAGLEATANKLPVMFMNTIIVKYVTGLPAELNTVKRQFKIEVVNGLPGNETITNAFISACNSL